MFQIINKNTNKIIYMEFAPTLNDLIAYKFDEDYLIVPIDLLDKDIEVVNGNVVEKSLDIEKIRQQWSDLLNIKIADNKSKKFELTINLANGKTIKTELDLLDKTLSELIALKNKSTKDLVLEDGSIVKVRYKTIFNIETKLNEFVPLLDSEINRLQIYLTYYMDLLDSAIVDSTNNILTASNEELIKFNSLDNLEKEIFIQDQIEKYIPFKE